MKKTVITLAVVAAIVTAFVAGRAAGIRHAIEAARVWTEGTSIMIDLDGELYEHTSDPN